MKVTDALPVLRVLCGQRVSSIVEKLPSDLKTNKGNVGQLLELYLGLRLGSWHTDFEDGELKTNYTNRDHSPKETIFITQIANDIDNLLSPTPVPFYRSLLHSKIRNLVIVQVIKDGPEQMWRFGHVFHVEVAPGSAIYRQFDADYGAICKGLRTHVSASTEAFIHTTSGRFIQVRSKDSKPYHPIHSKLYGRAVSNKNHAFYFRKEFMLQLLGSGSSFRRCRHPEFP